MNHGLYIPAFQPPTRTIDRASARRILYAVVLVILLALLLAANPTPAHADTCIVSGTITNASPYNPNYGRGYWIAVRYDNGTWSSFYSARYMAVGSRLTTFGPCADASRYSQPWLAWRRW